MKYSVDRIEENIVVCEDEKQNIVKIEKPLLPDRVKEGDIIETTDDGFRILADETAERRKKLASMQAGLFKNKRK